MNKTYSDNLVLGTSSQVTTIGTEAHAADVQIGSHVLGVVVLQDANLFASLDVKDLGGAIAAGGNVLAVVAKSHAADDALVGERMDQIDVENTLDGRVENGVPVAALLLVVRRDRFDLEVTERIADAARADHALVRGRVADLRRGIRGIRRRGVDLRGGRASGRAADASTARAGRSGALGRLRGHAVGALGIATVGRLLGVGVRRARHAGRTLRHLVLRAHLLVLGRSVLLRGSKALLVATGHDATKQAITRSD